MRLGQQAQLRAEAEPVEVRALNLVSPLPSLERWHTGQVCPVRGVGLWQNLIMQRARSHEQRLTLSKVFSDGAKVGENLLRWGRVPGPKVTGCGLSPARPGHFLRASSISPSVAQGSPESCVQLL